MPSLVTDVSAVTIVSAIFFRYWEEYPDLRVVISVSLITTTQKVDVLILNRKL